MRTRILRAALAVALALLAVGCLAAPAAAERQGQSFHWRGALAPGQTLTVKGINGSIRAEASSGAQVVVDAEKWGRRDDPDRVKIEVEEDRRGILVCARYPRRWGGGLTGCDGSGSTHSDVHVEYVVRVPVGVQATFATVNGGIEARELKGPVRARTVNGSVRVSTDDRADVKTVNGSIVARMRPRGSGDMHFATVNGSIRIELPADAQVDLHARTLNGSIHTDFPITIRGGWIGRRLEGRIGRGGPEIGMASVNGSISVLSQ